MTDEEKKAQEEAAKAAAAKKAQEEKAKKGGEDDPEDPEDDPEDGDKVEKSKYLKVKQEAIANRRENKELKARLAKIEQGLGLITGKEPDKAADEIATVRREGEAKQRRMLMIAELAAVASDAHNVKVLYNTAPEIFGAVEVDLEHDTVDEEMLAGAVKSARKKYPFLFKEPAAPAPKQDPKAPPAGGKAPPLQSPRTGAPPPDGSGSPGADGTLRQKWQELMDAGRTAEATKFWKDNRAGIMAEIKAAGK